jgi:uncharacterized damage-inducible protein DinB
MLLICFSVGCLIPAMPRQEREMITSIHEFKALWREESTFTRRTIAELTDAALSQPVTDDHRTLGRISWHVIASIPDTMCRTGLTVKGPALDSPPSTIAREHADTYDLASNSLMEALSSWTDADLETVDDMFGERWTRRFTLQVLINHQIHHRGQMTVLMRQAGLRVPGIYGPSKEDWAQWDMKPPVV